MSTPQKPGAGHAQGTATSSVPLAMLRRRGGHDFDLAPGAEERAALRDDLGLLDLGKLRFRGRIRPAGGQAWRLEAHLGATIAQPCVVSLAPVRSRIEEDVLRLYTPDLPQPDPGSEVQMNGDDSLEPLAEVIDLAAVMREALSLALPAFPRAEGASLPAAPPPGPQPAGARENPFAALGPLRESLAPESDNAPPAPAPPAKPDEPQ